MLQYLGTLFIFAIAYLVYAFWIRPLRTIKGYVKLLRNRGYKVLEVPFNPFQNDMITTMRKGRNKFGDDLKLYKQDRRDYDVIVSNTLNRPRLQFHHPDFIKQFYAVDKHYDFPKTESVVNVFTTIAGKGLTFSEGAQWRRKRNVLNKIFNFDFLKSLTNSIAVICDETIEEFEKKGQKNQQENSVSYSIIDFTTRIFSRVMMESFLGGSKDQCIQGVPAGQFLKTLLNDMSALCFSPINFLLGPKFTALGITKAQRDVNSRIEAYRNWGMAFIKKRIVQITQSLQKNPKNSQPSGILESLIIAKKASGENGDQTIITQKEMFEQFTTFFIAGTDTTSNFTQMMIYELARHPDVEAKVRKEVESYFKEEDYSYENLKNLVYVQMVQKEITRTFGPLNLLFSRYAKCDNYLNGLPIKKGTGVAIFHVGNHFSQKYFKNPQQFRPQRWQKQCNELPPFAFGGFSAGARTCIGKHLAMLQNKIAIVKFLKRYKKIILPSQQFKMYVRLMYMPEDLPVRMVINQ